MSTFKYQEISAQEASGLTGTDIKIVVENVSLTKHKSIQMSSDVPFKSSEDNENNFLIIEDGTAQACLQPFVINCEGALSVSETFIYNTNHAYKVTIDGVTSAVRGSDLNDFFSQNHITTIEI